MRFRSSDDIDRPLSAARFTVRLDEQELQALKGFADYQHVPSTAMRKLIHLCATLSQTRSAKTTATHSGRNANGKSVLSFRKTFSYKPRLATHWRNLMPRNSTKRRTWTPDNVRTLKTLARKKTNAARIAKTLKRSEAATRQKAFSLGLSLDSRA
jgi:hypothetical protein